MPRISIESIDTSLRRTLSVLLGLIEVALGIAQIAQGLGSLNWSSMQGGLKAIGSGLKSVEAGVEREGESWGAIGVRIRQLILLWILARLRRSGFFEPLRRYVEQPGQA